MRVIELTDDPNVTPRELTDLVQADSGLSSKILRTVNSAFYGLATPVASIKRAQILLGLNAIKTLTLGFSLVQSIRGSGGEADGFDYTTFWRRSLHAATCAKAVATRTGAMEPEEALLGGLLQDVGMVVLHRTLGETYDRVVRDAGGRHRELTRLELLELDLTHAVVGATLAERWRFPSSLITPIRHHEKPTAAPQAQRDAAKCVGLASLGASALTEADSIPELRRYLSSARSWLSLDEREAEAALEEAAAGAREFGKLLDVDAGAPVNTQTILESAKEKLVNLSAGPQVEDAVRRLRDERSLDSITGALSKTGLTERLGEAFERARDSEGAVSLAMIDVADLRAVNERHGRETGDALLRDVASRLADFFEPMGGDVARAGGETFAVLLPGVDHAGAARACRRLCASLEARPFGAGTRQEVPLSPRVGLTTLEPENARAFATAEMLVSASERALTAARGAEGAAVRAFVPQSVAA